MAVATRLRRQTSGLVDRPTVVVATTSCLLTFLAGIPASLTLSVSCPSRGVSYSNKECPRFYASSSLPSPSLRDACRKAKKYNSLRPVRPSSIAMLEYSQNLSMHRYSIIADTYTHSSWMAFHPQGVLQTALVLAPRSRCI